MISSSYTADAFLLLMTAGPLMLLALIVLIAIQSYRFKRKLDHLLFNSNHFNDRELATYNEFPSVIWKVLAYVRAIVFPKTMIKRFGDLFVPDHVSGLDKFLANLTIFISTFFIVILINATGSVILQYFSN